MVMEKITKVRRRDCEGPKLLKGFYFEWTKGYGVDGWTNDKGTRVERLGDA